MINTSIIIPTLNRPQATRRLLHDIGKQYAKDMEVIIVEQGQNNAQEYKKIATEYGMALTYICQREPNTSIAKNTGAKAAKGTYLIFYDDDVLLHENAVRNICKNFTDLTIGGVAGRVVDEGKKEEQDNKHVGKISLLTTFTDGFSSLIRQDVDTVIGCNAAWQKHVFQKIHGFDEQFTGNAMREESDLSLRAKKAGYRIVFDPTATVTHYREPTGGARKSDNRMYWFFHFFSNETYFFLKHRPILLFPFFLFTRISYILRCMFGIGREVSVRSIMTPLWAILDGWKKYAQYRKSL